MDQNRIVARRRNGSDYAPTETTVNGLVTADRVVFEKHGELIFWGNDGYAKKKVFAKANDNGAIEMLELEAAKVAGSPEGRAHYNCSLPTPIPLARGELGYGPVSRALGVGQ
jgi:hypothetical protein